MTGTLPYGLGRLDGLWPSKCLVTRYNAIVRTLGEMSPPVSRDWTENLGEVLNDATKATLDKEPGSDRQFRHSLRELSALSSMVMHLKPAGSIKGKAPPRNERRHRACYTSYPTSPRIGAAIARFAWEVLDRLETPNGRPARIHDPTMEGAPLLLEMAFEAARRAKLAAAGAAPRPTDAPLAMLSGTDQNPVAAPFVRGLFDRARARLDLGGLLFDAQTADAWEMLESTGALQAFVNNPPWGATTDGANNRPLTELGPFNGYRDPYIAYVATGLRKLQPGGAFGFVVPFQVLTATSASRLRQELLDNADLNVICHLPRSAFPRLTMRTVMILGRRARNGERRSSLLVLRYPMTRRICDPAEPSQSRLETLALRMTGAGPWTAVARTEPARVLGPSVRPLGEVASVLLGIEPYGVGRGRPKQTKADLEARPYTFDTPAADRTPVVRGRNVRKFHLLPPSELVRVGPWLAVPGRHSGQLGLPRVFVREICGRNGELVACVAPAGILARRGVMTITCGSIAPPVLCAILNSAIVAGLVRTNCAGFHKESFGRISADDLRRLPIPASLVRGADGAEGRAFRVGLTRAVARAARAALRDDVAGRRRATADIDRIVDGAYAR